ncbi:imidazole glycerol phosphate synthase subunit HisH [Sphingobacterium sp. UBA6320]|uniref:imidazole glycerol phosphate synthase subunit HisH n=1 Tax=Sphingobacterium sp. UBA6320 TaxID=1947510 RepID=UPI0025E4800E|nr:imidazole glycerol phosphate synthase subunit HisH [Sphingobacterium sp. UBA6320]
MITIIDYGVGNVNAFINIYRELGIECQASCLENEILNSNKLILPGVGHFDYAMEKLQKSNLIPVLNEMVFKQKVMVLGICVGMQMMANFSSEGILMGLGWIPSKVVKLDTTLRHKTLTPHMGWNNVEVNNLHPILNGIDDFYFLHSYVMECDNPENILTTTNYGVNFASIVNNENVFGIQCHPEKSHQSGIRFLRNFANL